MVAPIASLDAVIDAVDVDTLGQGTHMVSVRSKDAAGNWGALATINLVVDKAGPITTNVVASPNPNNGQLGFNPSTPAVRVTANLDDTTTGVSNIVAAEGFIDLVGTPTNGTGFVFVASDGLFNSQSETGYADIPLTTINQLNNGDHTISVHGKDAAGNWGTTSSTILVIERDIPTVTNVAVVPSSTDTTVLVALTATATDPTSDIARAEWFAGADPGTGNGTPMTVTWNGTTLVWDLAAPIDASGWAAADHTISVRARDAAGSWSATESAILTVTGGPPTAPELLYFSTAGSAAIPGVATPYDDADVYLWDSGPLSFIRTFDGSAVGLGNADIDGLAFDANAGGALGLYYMSFNRNGGTTVPGVGVVEDEDVVTYNPEDNEWQLYFAGADVCDGMDASLSLIHI